MLKWKTHTISCLHSTFFIVNCSSTKQTAENTNVSTAKKKVPLFGRRPPYIFDDRRFNGDKSNDLNYDRTKTAGKLRGLKVAISKVSKK
jgi:alpha-amylase